MWDTLVEHCSEDRLNKYLTKVAEDQLAAEFLYVANQKISESLYPLISILEVSLRNRVHSKLHIKLRRSDWWTHQDLNIQAFQPCLDKIDRAKAKLYKRPSVSDKQQVKAVQVVAEVSLGFWTSLFSEDLAPALWSDLIDCFPNLPTDNRKRRKVAKPLENITRLRNRVMHHEPILFDDSVLPNSLHSKGTELLGWMSTDMAAWLANGDRFDTVWSEYDSVRLQLDDWLTCRAALKEARNSGNAKSLRPLYAAVEASKVKFDDLAYQYLKKAKATLPASQPKDLATG